MSLVSLWIQRKLQEFGLHNPYFLHIGSKLQNKEIIYSDQYQISTLDVIYHSFNLIAENLRVKSCKGKGN